MDQDQSNKKLRCKHYRRRCSIISPCCQQEFKCRLCHDDQYGKPNSCPVEKLDRFSIQKIKCLECEQLQDQSNQCIHCQIQFAKYYCGVCKLWDDDPSKKIFHCEDCGICRIGNKESVKHCYKCGMCFPSDSFDQHNCVLTLKADKCCICFEDFFNSRDPMVPFGQCKHYLHNKCFRKYIRTNINCPICGQSYQKEDPNLIESIDNQVERTKEFFNDAPFFDIWCHNC